MRILNFLLKKEFKQIFRNITILRMIIAIPIIQLVIMPLAADYEIKNIRISVVDHDHSQYSKFLINKILSSKYFLLNDYSNSFTESFQEFQKNNSDLVLEIPKNFEKELIRENKSNVFIAVNAINGTKAIVGSSYLSKIILEYNKNIITKWIQPQRTNKMPVIDIVSLNWFNPRLKYQFFMVPGILVILVTLVCSYMCALNIVKEKEIGTIEQLNVTPIKKHIFILGKMIPFLLIGIFIFTLGFFLVAIFIYGIEPKGSILLIYGYLIIYLITSLGIGLLISTYSKTQQQAMSLAFFCVMIFILLSGLFTSIDSMPEWAQWIAKTNPVTYFIEALRMIILKGSGFVDLKKHFLITTIMAVFFNSWAIWNYKKKS